VSVAAVDALPAASWDTTLTTLVPATRLRVGIDQLIDVPGEDVAVPPLVTHWIQVQVTDVTLTLSAAVPLTAIGEVVVLDVGGIGLVIATVGMVVSGVALGSAIGCVDIINSSNHIAAPVERVATPV
jgi:hypothetical protein